jgi:ABC-2 type transport system permease protein
MWCIWTISIVGGWLISLLVNFAIGLLSLFLESSVKVMDVYLALFFVLSGYLIPVELFSPTLRTVAGALPFRYQLGLPVELMTGAYSLSDAIGMLARQWGMVAAMGLIVRVLWTRGARRFAAFGG